jgi:hypothetical protein
MAKSKDNKSKDKKSSVPKKVAGVKVPKAVRESKSLSTLLTSNLGREILADALIAAAGAAAAALTRTRTAHNAGQSVVDASAGASDAVQTAAGAVASVVSQAAKSFLPPSLLGESGSGEDERPRYLNKASDHSSRKRSAKGAKKTAKKAAGAGKKRSRKKDE